MLFNVADSTKVPVFPSSDLPSSDLSIVEQLNTPEKLGDFLKGRLENLDNHINTLIAQEVNGEAFLEITQVDLKNLGIPLGPAKRILKKLKEVNNFSFLSYSPTITNTYIILCFSSRQTAQKTHSHYRQVRARSPSLTVEDIDERKRLKREKGYFFILFNYQVDELTSFLFSRPDTVSRGLETNNLSVGSKPKVFFKNQHSHPIFNGRPFGNSGPPITLYSDTFVKFLNDFNNVDQIIPPDFLQWTEQLIIAASDSYIDEETRNTKIRTIFSMKLGTVIIIEYGEGRQKCKSNGTFATIRMNDLLTAYMGIFEERMKLEKVEVIPPFKEQYITEIIGLGQIYV
ncbi:hypothetical protein RclHR1_00410004 [Rhizophagus clarus]|uniref:SAM domain-containing protein n=1 Tax=Rhizophagus clarus TaxID=94130 RepID=A0A2Z6S9D1_9GLOM|nr:hypothetical protein RclHR1_00410004 [Rhizophagus clarus]